MTCDMHDLAALYALDALDPDERATFEQHLRNCGACRAAVEGFRETTDQLAAADAIAPPSALRDRVLDEIGHTPQDNVVDAPVALRTRRPATPALLAIAAAVVLLVAGGSLLMSLRGGSTDVDDVIAAPDAVATALALTPDGEAGSVRVVWSAEQERVALVGDDLPDPGDDRVYQLWAIVGGSPVPAGLFEPDGDSVSATADVAGLAEATPTAWGVTIEPARGSVAPTTPILFFAEA